MPGQCQACVERQGRYPTDRLEQRVSIRSGCRFVHTIADRPVAGAHAAAIERNQPLDYTAYRMQATGTDIDHARDCR